MSAGSSRCALDQLFGFRLIAGALPSGVYLSRMEGGYRGTMRMTLVR